MLRSVLALALVACLPGLAAQEVAAVEDGAQTLSTPPAELDQASIVKMYSGVDDLTVTFPVSLLVDIDGQAQHTLQVKAGDSLLVAAHRFCAAINVDSSNVPRLVNSLIDEAMRVASASVQPGEVAAIGVAVRNMVERVAVREGETPQQAARRFMSQQGLGTDAELDSYLRLLVNGLRAELGIEDGLPLTTDKQPTVTSVDVNMGDGTGRLVRLRVLQGETPRAAALGFLDRVGMPEVPNLQLLVDAINAKLGAPAGGGGTAPTIEMPEVDPAQGVSMRIELPERGWFPLIHYYSATPQDTAAEFLARHNLQDNAEYDRFVAQLARGIERRIEEVRRLSEAVQATPQTGGAADSDDLPLLVAPFDADLPIRVGTYGMEVSVAAGTPLAQAAAFICAQQWAELAPRLQAQLDGLALGDMPLQQREATQEMCSLMLFNVIVNAFDEVAPTKTA